MGQVLEPTARPSNSNILPEHNASFISTITFQWLQPLMSLGASRPLQKADLYSLSPQYRAADNYAKFVKAWAKERQKPKPSLLRALFSIYGGDYLFSLFLKLLGDLAQISGPLLLQELAIFTSRSYRHRNERRSSVENTVYGYTIPFIFLSVVVFGTFCYNYNYHIATMVGNKIRTCLITGIYRKSFVLSAKARQEFSSGKVVNMMSTDTNRIEMVMVYLSFLLITPLQILVALILLYLNLGVAALTGFAVMVIVSPSQTTVLKRLISLRKKTAELTDQRVRVTQECVTGIRVIKFFSWENKFLEKILNLRDAEAIKAKILMMLRECVFATALSIPAFASFLSFMTYSLLGNRLTPVVVFSSVAFFNLIRLPLLLLPLVLTSGTDALVSLKRIEKYFLAEEMDPEIMERLNLTQAQDDDFPKVMVTVSDGEFHYEQTIKDNQRTKEKLPRTGTERRQSWYMKGFYTRRRSQLKDEVVISDEKSKPSSSTSVASNDEFYKLKNINLRIRRGSLVAIVGTVGSGKSSLLNALIGEMRKVNGAVKFGGTIAYCPQTAWIQNANLKENIIFGSPWDAERYAMVINTCALQADLNQLPDGDCTEIGERGINLSGGQKQRINLARAVYSDPDIILLDDPLSAVDAHVGKYLFEECIAGPALKNKTRLLVTHQLHLLQHCDWIIVMDQGRIRNQGTLQDLLSGDFAFANIMKEHGGGTNEKEEIQTLKESSTVSDNVKGEEKPQALHQEEERLTGAVSAEVYRNYFKAGGGWVTFSLLLLSLILAQLIRVFTDLWLSAWTTRQYQISKGSYIGIYAIWSSSQLFGFMFFGIMTAYIAVSASKVLHNAAIKSLLRSPVSFFDTTPTGRILNRFSKDVDALDFVIGDSLRMFLNTLGLITATFCLISVIFPYFLIPLVPILVFYYFFARYYRHTSRELKRLDSITRSPLYAQFSETLTGLPTIRSYGKQVVFQERNQTLLDENNMAYALYIMTQRWLGLRLETLANLTSFSSMLIAIFLRYQINPSYSALVVTYAIQVTGVFNWCVRQAAEVECNLNSVERLQHYITELEHEAPAILDAPPRNWPSKGEIEFVDVELRYRRDLPLVLRGVCLKFQGGEKIGVVGRTGSGKSTIMLALFRIVELAGGSIHIDGVDISTLGLADLRSKMAIIPQDPMLFEGTFRSNLDPFGAHDDQAIWDALERTEMKDHVKQQLGGLDAKVTEGGENLSVGQRQLLCLCRAMLVQNAKIIVMDEATASVDLPTDTLLQASIRRDFVGCTILTIAHRLNTVMDYDKILVLEHGKVLEFGAPWELLRRPESALSGMVDQTGLENAKFLRSIAEKAYKVDDV